MFIASLCGESRGRGDDIVFLFSPSKCVHAHAILGDERFNRNLCNKISACRAKRPRRNIRKKKCLTFVFVFFFSSRIFSLFVLVSPPVFVFPSLRSCSLLLLSASKKTNIVYLRDMSSEEYLLKRSLYGDPVNRKRGKLSEAEKAAPAMDSRKGMYNSMGPVQVSVEFATSSELG